MDAQSKDFFTFLMDANYSLRNEWFDFLLSKAKPGGVVFAGDSIIQEFCIHEMLPLPNGIQIHNRGIGGDTTNGLLKRVQNSILKLKPAVVFILIGTNDLNDSDYSEKESIDNIRKIFSISRKELPKTKMILLGLLPTNPNIDAITVADRSLKKIHSFNVLLQNLAIEYDQIFLNLNFVFCNEKGLLRENLTRDGLHLKPIGYEILLKELMPFIQF